MQASWSYVILYSISQQQKLWKNKLNNRESLMTCFLKTKFGLTQRPEYITFKTGNILISPTNEQVRISEDLQTAHRFWFYISNIYNSHLTLTVWSQLGHRLTTISKILLNKEALTDSYTNVKKEKINMKTKLQGTKQLRASECIRCRQSLGTCIQASWVSVSLAGKI